tara:strand:- start:765 stop:1049 length:285 start_codon:yes stop_codon:yes gene_type:complete
MFIDTIEGSIDYLLKIKYEYFKSKFDAFEGWKCTICDVYYNVIYEGDHKCHCFYIPNGDRRRRQSLSGGVWVKPKYGLTPTQMEKVIIMYHLLK